MTRVHADWLLTTARAAVYLPSRTAVVADLHLGYDRTRVRSGEAVPLRTLGETLAPLRAAFTRHAVRSLVVAGDLFESKAGDDVAEEFLAWLRAAGVALAAVVPGNHDRGIASRHAGLPFVPGGVDLGDWRVVHGHEALPPGPLVHGHFHPCLRLAGGIAAACYLVGVARLVLPAFSADAAGVNVIGRPQWQAYHCHAIAGDRLLDFGPLAGLRAQSKMQKGKRHEG